LANFNVKFPSTKVNRNLSTVLVMNMYKRNKFQLCIHFMYSVVTKLNMNNYHPHSQYNCANVSVELTSITVLTIMNIITLCSLRDRSWAWENPLLQKAGQRNHFSKSDTW